MDDMTVANEATTYWLSFFLMTIGWFILLTSLLSFWRVKRWERNILASQRETSVSSRAAAGQSSHAFSMRIHRFMGAPVRDMSSLVLTGLGLSRRFRGADPEASEDDHDLDRAVPMTPLRLVPPEETSRREMIIAMYSHDPERQRQIVQAFRDDDQLMADMRAAGML